MQGPPQGIVEKVRTLGQLMKMASYQPKIVNNAPCQEVVLRGEEVDLERFPILKCWPEDGGRYVTLPLVITKDPITGSRNVGTYRMQVFDRNTCGMHWQTQKVGTHHYRISQQKKLEKMEDKVRKIDKGYHDLWLYKDADDPASLEHDEYKRLSAKEAGPHISKFITGWFKSVSYTHLTLPTKA